MAHNDWRLVRNDTRDNWHVESHDVVNGQRIGYQVATILREADARLIAAAPDMYDLLRDVVHTMPLGSAWAARTTDEIYRLFGKIKGETA